MSGVPEWVYIYDPENAVEYGVKITDQKGAGIQSVRYGYVRADISEAAIAAARAEGERIGMERAIQVVRQIDPCEGDDFFDGLERSIRAIRTAMDAKP